MPNHVSHKIEFSCPNPEGIISSITIDGAVNFNTLIPKPVWIYNAPHSSIESDDFGGNIWYDWCIANWGTKWNAYNTDISTDGNRIVIYFETAWSIPYPFIIAFANKHGLEFTHKYYDKGGNFWGIDKWKEGKRVDRNRDSELEKGLAIELTGWDPEAEEE